MRTTQVLMALMVMAAVCRAGVEAQSSDAERIAAASRAFSDAYVRGDTSQIRNLYTADAVLLPPGREVRGRDRIVEYFAPSPNRQNLTHSMESAELRVSGGVAVDIGTWSNTWRMGDAEPRSAAETYLVVWRKGSDGRWRIEYDMWHRPNG